MQGFTFLVKLFLQKYVFSIKFKLVCDSGTYTAENPNWICIHFSLQVYQVRYILLTLHIQGKFSVWYYTL